MAHILPENSNQPLIKVNISSPDEHRYEILDGIFAKNEVFAGIQSAIQILEREQPDKIITIGGNCVVSQSSFDYLRGKYSSVGVIWIDTHPVFYSLKWLSKCPCNGTRSVARAG